jgi:glycosyltransferase involved in cell wall biosynthesis
MNLLRQLGRALHHELELAVDGDELPTFGDAPLGIFDGKDVQAGRDPVSDRRLANAGEGVFHLLLAGRSAVRSAHGPSEVVGTDEDRVDAGDGVNLIGNLDSGDVLGLDHNQDLVVRSFVVFLGSAPIVQVVQAATDGPVSLGRVFRGRNNRFGLLGVHHHGADDPHGATVENGFDEVVTARVDANQRYAARVSDAAEHEGGGMDVGVGMFHIDREPRQAGPGQETRSHHAAQREPSPDLRLSGLQRPLHWVRLQGNAPTLVRSSSSLLDRPSVPAHPSRVNGSAAASPPGKQELTARGKIAYHAAERIDPTPIGPTRADPSMRVTLVTETFAPQVNGVSRTLGNLVRSLAEAGDVVQVIHPDYKSPLPEGHVAVRSIGMPFYKELRVPLPPFGRVYRAIDRFGPDLVHIATEATLGLSALRHSSRRGLPVVSSFHTHFDQYTGHYGVGWTRGLIWRYLRWFHNRTLETYVPSRATMAVLRSRGFKRLVLWPRGVDGTLFRPDRPGRERVRQALGIGPDDLVIGHVGRIAMEKNVGYLGAALARVVTERPRVRVLIVGDGPSRSELETRLGPSAHFVGYRTGDDLADHYSAADLFAFTSRTETFGNVVLEALASGLPVVALRIGGPRDIISDGVNGYLVPPEAPPEQFAETLVSLVDDTEKRVGMAKTARDLALPQTWEAIMAGLRKHYLAVVGEASTLPTASASMK